MVFPYHPLLSSKLTSYFKSQNITTIFKNTNKLDTIVKKGKDKLPTMRQHNVIYKIECNDCESSYVGQTYRALEIRLQEHQKNILIPDKHNAISKHRVTFKHDMKWDKPKVLDCERNQYKRDISEMLHIKRNKNSINVQQDTAKLNTLYFSIL